MTNPDSTPTFFGSGDFLESENCFSSPNPEEFVKYLALGKARAVAKQNPDAVIIGADTVIFHDNKIMGKPKDAEHARRILKSCSGLTHAVYSGIAVIYRRAEVVDTSTANVTFKNLTDEEIKKYISTNSRFESEF